jgi:hypothetical protein
MRWFEVRYKTPHSLHANPDAYLRYAETALRTMQQGIEQEILDRIRTIEQMHNGARYVGMSTVAATGTELNLLRDWLVRLCPDKYAPRLTSFAAPMQRLGATPKALRVKPVYLMIALVVILLLAGIGVSIWLLQR